MICWSCQKAAGPGVLCAACGAVQPPDPQADYFRVFGIPCAFAVDQIHMHVASTRVDTQPACALTVAVYESEGWSRHSLAAHGQMR